MLQQIYRRPPCRRAISIKLCSNIIKTLLVTFSVWLSPIDLLADFNSLYSEQLGEAAFVILTFLQEHKRNSSFAFVCVCTENKIQLQMSSKHIYSHKQ